MNRIFSCTIKRITKQLDKSGFNKVIHLPKFSLAIFNHLIHSIKNVNNLTLFR